MSRFIRLITLFAALLIIGGGHAWAFSVDNIRIGEHPGKVRMVVDLSGPSDFRAYALDNPYRIVIDMPAFDWRVGAFSKPGGSFITSVRQGALQPGISRIVIDVSRPVALQSAFILPAQDGKPNRLVIDYAGTDERGFAAKKAKMFGNLNIGAPPTMPPPPVAAAPAPANVQQPQSLGQLPVDASGMVIPARKPQMPEPVTTTTVTTTTVTETEIVPTPVAAYEPPPAMPAKPRGEKPLIVIDAGHGGVDPGAIAANGVFEKNVTLAMARELKKQLENSGRYRVELTRDKDIYLKLFQRVGIARKKNADLFISLHADSINKSAVQGASIYTLSEKASDAQTERLAERENRADLITGVDLNHEDEQVADILVDLTVRDTMNQSKFFANTVVAQMGSNGMKLLDNPHRYAGFAVLKAPDVPSVLIEIGFMSNKSEVERLSNPEHRRKIAGAIMDGIDAYFARLRS